MAKVRIQARSADIQDASKDYEQPRHLKEPRRKHKKQIGALDILADVWKREGYTGWYQVSTSYVYFLHDSDFDIREGHASPDNESCPFASSAFYVERAI